MDTTLISPGPPAVHKQRTKTEKFGTLTRVTVGRKNMRQTNKTILLVGETGTGKSTLINTLFNYIIGVKFKDEVWYQIVEEEGQTSDVIVYEIFGFENKTLAFSLTIIDTPGFGDTKQDVIVNQRLFDLFRSEDGVHELDAVGLVMKVTDNQPSDHLKYLFDSVMFLFGKDLKRDTVALITHSDGTTPGTALRALEGAATECFRNEKKQPAHFLFNNCQNEERTEKTRSDLEESWSVTEKGMNEFIAFLQKTSSHQLQTTSGLNSSVRSTGYVQNLQEKIELIELKQTEIKQIQDALEKHGEMESEEFTVEVNEPYKDREPIEGEMLFLKEAVCCTVCEENCHYPGCTMALNPEDCEVMKYGRCTVCTGKCPISAHVKVNWRYVTNTRKVQRTSEQSRRRYEKNKTDSQKVKLFEMLANEMERLKSQKSQLVEESYQHVVKLNQTVLKVNSLSTYVPLDLLMKKMREKGDTKKLQKLEEIQSQMDEGAKAVLQCKSEEAFPDVLDNLMSDQLRSEVAFPDVLDNLMSDQPSIKKTAPQQNTSNKVQISPGPPAVYQLITDKKMFGSLTKVIIGEKDENKPNKTILLVGETGTGKSTLINALFNYTVGVEFEDDVWYQIVEDERRSQTESQTSDVLVYQIFGFEDKDLPCSLTIIDTPGFGDTRGIELDVIVSERLFDLFRSEEGVHEIHAVGLVMKSSTNRVSDRLMYIFDSVMSLFGKDVENNIVPLITHSNGKTPKDPLQALETAKIECARNENNQPVYFLFNNSQHEDRTEDAEFLEKDFKVTVKGLSSFSGFLEKIAPQKLGTTLDVLNKRIRLTACVQNLKERIDLIELKQREIKQIQEALEKHQGEMKKNEKFTIEVDEVCRDKESLDDGMWLMTLIKAAVCCTVCEENCHYPGCTSSHTPQDCEVMKDGYCTVCTGKCPAADHVKGKWRFVTKTRKVQKTLADLKDRGDKKNPERAKQLSLLENLENEMKQLTEEKSQLLDESFQHVVSLEQIALRVNSVSTYVHFDFLIEKMKENGETEKVLKLEEIKSREDEGVQSKLEYVCGKLTKN